MFGGQRVNVTIAVSRETISDINKMKEKQPKDKRNLYLAREGVIRDGTQAAEGVSKTDMNKRNKVHSVYCSLSASYTYVLESHLTESKLHDLARVLIAEKVPPNGSALSFAIDNCR